MGFKESFSFDERKEDSKKVLEKYKDRVPVIVQRAHRCKEVPEIEKIKYIVPLDITIGQFIYVIRKRIKLDASQALFVFINGTIPNISDIISTIYEKDKEDDGFLYIYYSGENTFG